LAMPRARFGVTVGDADEGDTDEGDPVTWLLAANPGEPALPLAKVASGGELARTMLAVRLVLGGLAGNPGAAGGGGAAGAVGAGGAPGSPGGAPGSPGAGRTLIFDEVDAGIGGEAAVAVGRALAQIARSHQVLVVTHLAQVAAFADHHVVVRKSEADGRTVAGVEVLTDKQRAVELARMLSGQPDSATGRRHARELLASARAERKASS
jgi:DNA repair protein RecN (Recombination protein N)